MPWQPFERLKIDVAFFTAASNSASNPGLTSICAISVIIVVFTQCSQCAAPYHGGSGIEVRKRGGLPCQRQLPMRGSCGMWARAAYNQGL